MTETIAFFSPHQSSFLFKKKKMQTVKAKDIAPDLSSGNKFQASLSASKLNSVEIKQETFISHQERCCKEWKSTMNRLGLGFSYFKVSLNLFRFSLIRETDSQMLSHYDIHLALSNLTKLMIRLIFFVSCDRKSERIERIFKTQS